MRNVIILTLSFMLLSCIYADGCLYTPQAVTCRDKGKVFPAIARYQKSYSLGKTDATQRWNDATMCGAKYGDEELDSIIKYNSDGSYNSTYRDNFHNCMKSKGYIILQPADCGYQSKEWNTGKCNL